MKRPNVHVLGVYFAYPVLISEACFVTLSLVPRYEPDCCLKTIITAEEVASRGTLDDHDPLDSKT
jgi:hypothetical protein